MKKRFNTVNDSGDRLILDINLKNNRVEIYGRDNGIAYSLSELVPEVKGSMTEQAAYAKEAILDNPTIEGLNDLGPQSKHMGWGEE